MYKKKLNFVFISTNSINKMSISLNLQIHKDTIKINVFEEFINIDIIEQIIKYTDIKTLIRLLQSCRKTLNIYKNNKNFFSLKIINSIMYKFDYYNFNFTFKLEDPIQISKSLLNIYNNLKTIKHKHRLIYIVKNNLKSLELFKFFTNDYIYKISESDIQYIISHCNIDQLNIFLRSNNASCGAILNAIIYRYNYDRLWFNSIVKIFIQYIFCKYHFNKFNQENNLTYHNILIFLIKTGNRECVEYIICNKKNKYKNKINYQLLVNQCIEIRNVYLLNVLIKEMKNDNLANINKVYVTIHYKHIYNLSNIGSFEYLRYIIDNFIGYNINAKLYIQSICDGINDDINTSNINILISSDYLTSENKMYINSYLHVN